METKGFNIVNTSGGLYNSINDTILADGARRIIYEDSYFSVSTYRSVKKHLRYEELIPAGDMLLRIRVIKDEQEIAAMRDAAKITDEAFDFVRSLLHVGACEKDIALKAQIRLMELGAQSFPFRPSVVSGARSAMPSAVSGAKELAFGDIVIVSLGIIYKGYCSDCCRTYFMGSADEEGRAMYEAVSSVRKDVLSGAKTGTPCAAVDASARNGFTRLGYREGYIHSAGHGIVISAMELPHINLRSSDTLCTNMAVSIGAGIYKSGVGGVRITDSAIITPDGCEKLTKSPDELMVL